MFKDIIGDIPEARILDFLLLYPNTSHTLSKIVDGTDLNFRTAKRKIENLVDTGIVEISHEDGKSKYYMINTSKLVNEFDKMMGMWVR